MEYLKKTDDPNYHKKWYEKNRKRILQDATQPIECECGKVVSKCNLLKHKNTAVHKRVLKLIQNVQNN